MDKWIERMERVTANAVWRALKKQKAELEKYLREVGLPNDTEVRRILGDSARGVVEAFIRRSKTTLDRAYKNAGKSGPIPLIGIDWALPAHPAPLYINALKDLHLSERKGSISATTEERVKKLVRDGLKDGMSRADIAKNIEKLDPQVFSKNRSELIAINQIHKAQNYGEYIARKEFHDAGYLVLKYWSTANDNRVTRTHTANQSDGWKGFDKTFSGTGDTIPPASDNPRCRCVLKYEIGELRGEKQPKDIEQKLLANELKEKNIDFFEKLKNNYIERADYLKKETLVENEKIIENFQLLYADDKLTKEEINAIYEYSKSAYRNMNKNLRDGDYFHQYSGLTMDLQSALFGLPNYNSTTYRGIMSEVVREKYENMEIGEIFMEEAFVSTSKSIQRAKEFAGEDGIFIEVRGKTGRDIEKYSRHQKEKEVLFNAGSIFVLLAKKGNKFIIQEI